MMASLINFSQLFIVVFSLLATSQLPGGSSQDLQTLSLKLQELQANLDTLKDHPDFNKELHNAQDALQELWTVYLPELWQNGSLLSPKCMKSVDYLMPGLKDNSSDEFPTKIVPLLDAVGKQGAGLLIGNTILDGAYDECFSYNYTGFCLASQVYPAIPMKLPLIWKVGFCVPKYCTNTDLAVLINATTIFRVSEHAILCENSKTPSYSAGAIVMLIVTMIFTTMVVAGTIFDVLVQYIPLYLNVKYCGSQSVAVNTNSSHNPDASEEMPLLAQPFINKPAGVKPWDFITAFSLFKTVPTLLATKQTPSVITSLNGLRVISMFWVILGHTFSFLTSFMNVDNPVIIMSVLSRFSFQAVGNALFCVDSFFFLSGVLVAYLTLREMKKKNGRFPFLHYYVHRYLRLTPAYAFVLFFAWFLTSHLAYGPYISLYDPFREPCSKYWWTNLLYINNLYPWKLSDECIGWSWYLANDMQFYVISPLILIAAYHLLPVGLSIAGLFLGSGFLITGVLTGVYDFQGNMISSLAYGYANKPNATQTFLDAIYIKPWDRIAPYIVGLALGYILYRGFRFQFGRIINSLLYGMLWYIAAFIAFWIVYGLYFTWHGHIPHTAENVIYITFSRFLWAMCLALMVFACHNGYGWFINSFLSMKIWTPLARMTFNVYLVHPVVLIVVYGQLQTSIHYTDISIACYAIAFVVLSYGVAAVVCVLVELPLGTVEMLIFKVFGSKGRDSQRQDVNMEVTKEIVEA